MVGIYVLLQLEYITYNSTRFCFNCYGCITSSKWINAKYFSILLRVCLMLLINHSIVPVTVKWSWSIGCQTGQSGPYQQPASGAYIVYVGTGTNRCTLCYSLLCRLMVFANTLLHFYPMVVSTSLLSLRKHIWRYWTSKMFARYILSRVCV